MAFAERVDDVVQLTTQFREKDLVRQVPGTRYDSKKKTWYMPLSWSTAWVLHGVFGDSLQVGPDLSQWVRQEYAERIEPAMALRMAHDVVEDDPLQDLTLYPYQRVGSRFLLTAGQALMADEMGTGKTVQSLAALRELSGHGVPALVVCPNSMKHTWREEVETWYPEANVAVLEGNINQRRKIIEQVHDGAVDVLVVNWEQLRSHSRLSGYGSIALKRCEVCDPTTTRKQHLCERCEKELNHIDWKVVIADEAHRAKNPEAKQTRALWSVSKHADYRWALTGTPVSGRPDDLWSILHFVSPQEWPSKGAYIDRYCLSTWNHWGGLDVVGLRHDTKEEFFKVLDPRMIRRTKDMVLPDLPAKVYSTRFVELSTKQKRAYNEIMKTMLAELDNGLEAVTDPLVKLTRMLQLTSAFAELDEAGNWRMTNPSSKLDTLMEVLEEAGEQQVAVFAESRQLIQLAEQRLRDASIEFASIHGEVHPAERQRAVHRLDSGEVRVLLATLATGGEGLTLTAASTLVFLERSYSMIKNKQAEDRLHRIGQVADQVHIIDLVATGTIDEERLAVLEGKAQTLEEVVRDADALRRYLEG